MRVCMQECACVFVFACGMCDCLSKCVVLCKLYIIVCKILRALNCFLFVMGSVRLINIVIIIIISKFQNWRVNANLDIMCFTNIF